MRLLLFVLILSISFPELSAQNLNRDSLLNRYALYHNKPREQVYVHFNKQNFFAGETVWFRAFVVNGFSRKPILNQTGLYAELYDEKQKLIARKIYSVFNGICQGDFKLPSGGLSGIYTVKAYTTEWINFKENTACVSRVFVSGRKATDEEAKVPITLKADFFPEGGTLLKGVENNVAFKITDASGKPVNLKGYLKRNGQILEHLQSGPDGLGSFLSPSANEDLKVVFETGVNKFEEYTLPTSSKGLQLNAGKASEGRLLVSIKTNEPKNFANAPANFYLLFHRQGYAELYSVVLNGLVSTEVVIPIAGKRAGVWNITLLDSSIHVLNQRPLFIAAQECFSSVQTEAIKTGDSVSVQVITDEIANKKIVGGLSVSVTGPSERQLGKSNIVNRYLLSSELNTLPEQTEYFENCILTDAAQLDALLLSTANKNYNWDRILSSAINKSLLSDQQGITITGQVPNYRSKSRSLFLLSPVNDLNFLVPVDETGKFRIENLFLKDSSTLYFNASSEAETKYFNNITIDQTQFPFDTTGVTKPVMKAINTAVIPPIIDTGNYNVLEEVKVKSKSSVLQPFQNDPMVMPGDVVRTVDSKTVNRYRNVLHYLQREFGLVPGEDALGNIIINMQRGPASILLKSPPVLVIDGMILDNLNALNTLNFVDVEAIAVNKNGNSMLGSRGAGGSIIIKTRKNLDNLTEPSDNNLVVAKKVVSGYSVPNEFTVPKQVRNYTDPRYASYLPLFFNPNVMMNAQGDSKITFFAPQNLKQITITIEGVTEEGELISVQKTVDIK